MSLFFISSLYIQFYIMTRFVTLTLAALMALAVSVQAAPTGEYAKRTLYKTSSASIDTTPAGVPIPGHHRTAGQQQGENENEITGDENEPEEVTGDENEPNENEPNENEVTGNEHTGNEHTGNEKEGPTDGA